MLFHRYLSGRNTVLCGVKIYFPYSYGIKNVFSLVMDISPEITIEVNPGTIDKEKLIEYKNAGINA